jgi:hypothetical protein
MDVTNFPPDAEGLTAAILVSPRAIPWADAGARARFRSEVARSYPQLFALCLLGQKEYFCDEVARLVNEGILPNIVGSDRLAYDAATALCRSAGLWTAGDRAAEFKEHARPRAPSVALAAFLKRNCVEEDGRGARLP